jgi:hypothetical protein
MSFSNNTNKRVNSQFKKGLTYEKNKDKMPIQIVLDKISLQKK